MNDDEKLARAVGFYDSPEGVREPTGRLFGPTWPDFAKDPAACARWLTSWLQSVADEKDLWLSFKWVNGEKWHGALLGDEDKDDRKSEGDTFAEAVTALALAVVDTMEASR